jgi:hypothetical protein
MVAMSVFGKKGGMASLEVALLLTGIILPLITAFFALYQQLDLYYEIELELARAVRLPTRNSLKFWVGSMDLWVRNPIKEMATYAMRKGRKFDIEEMLRLDLSSEAGKLNTRLKDYGEVEALLLGNLFFPVVAMGGSVPHSLIKLEKLDVRVKGEGCGIYDAYFESDLEKRLGRPLQNPAILCGKLDFSPKLIELLRDNLNLEQGVFPALRAGGSIERVYGATHLMHDGQKKNSAFIDGNTSLTFSHLRVSGIALAAVIMKPKSFLGAVTKREINFLQIKPIDYTF